jgi:hypothetical protein
MKLLDTIEGERISVITETGSEIVVFYGDADIDCDGSGGNPDHDPYFQPDTTLHYKGKALNPYEVPFIVVPPVVVRRTKGIVMGSQAYISYKGITIPAVVGDLGPTRKVGEISVEAAKRLKIPWNPNWGGVEAKEVGYVVQVGVKAYVDGILYELQPA